MRINLNINQRALRGAGLRALRFAGPRPHRVAGPRVLQIACAVAFVVLAGCAARLPEPGAAEAMRAARLWPGTTVGDLHRGKQRYAQACSACHGLIDPHRFPSGRWPTFVKEMSGKLQLSPGDVTDLTRYLVVASDSAPAP